MKKIIPVLLGSFLAIILMIGCTTTNYIGANITKPTMLNGSSALSQKSTVVKSFTIEEYSSWYFWGLQIARDADLNKTITDEIASVDGDAVINLRIQQTLTIKDYILTLFTFGIWGRRTSFITGDVIKYD